MDEDLDISWENPQIQPYQFEPYQFEFLSKLKMVGKASAFSRSLRGLNSDPSCALNSILCSKLSEEKCMEQRRHAIVGVKSFLFINLTHSLHLFSSLGNVKRLKPDFEQVLQLKAAQNTVLKLLMFWYCRI